MVLKDLIDFVLHIDNYLGVIIQNYGAVTYMILFLIIFLETGFVIAPFLPGDSLLFVAGAFAARGVINLFLLFIIFSIAAILGDSVNYWIGGYVGDRLFLKRGLIKQENLEKTKEFFARHGGKTIILARFMPIIRTLAPFVAGVGKMHYFRFFSYNVIGGLCWVAIFLFSGYWFGQIPFVQKNLTLFILIIVLSSFLPILVEYVRKKN